MLCSRCTLLLRDFFLVYGTFARPFAWRKLHKTICFRLDKVWPQAVTHSHFYYQSAVKSSIFSADFLFFDLLFLVLLPEQGTLQTCHFFLWWRQKTLFPPLFARWINAGLSSAPHNSNQNSRKKTVPIFLAVDIVYDELRYKCIFTTVKRDSQYAYLCVLLDTFPKAHQRHYMLSAHTVHVMRFVLQKQKMPGCMFYCNTFRVDSYSTLKYEIT